VDFLEALLYEVIMLNMAENEFLTTEERAAKLKVHVQTVRRYIREGKLKAIRLEGAYRVRRGDFQKFLENRRTNR
jgi:excisionase family DNA binding protein